MDAERTPVIAAAGQAIERSEIVDAVELAARASERALDLADGLRSRIQRVTMVSVVFSRVSEKPASELVQRIGLQDVEAESTTPGGNLPQWLVTRAATEIADGRLGATLIAGAEAARSMPARGPDADSTGDPRGKHAPRDSDPVVGPPMKGSWSAAEKGIRLFAPTEVYPLFENALAHRNGRTYDEQRAFLGPLMAAFSEVASRHPFAWFRGALSAEEISKVTEANRLISEPYTKQMNAFPTVDQGAAVVVTSLATARALGLEDRSLFVWSGANAAEPAPAARPDLSDAPSMRAASQAALGAVGIDADDLALIDLYSCFPIAVEVAASGLGVSLDDPRGLTVTPCTPSRRSRTGFRRAAGSATSAPTAATSPNTRWGSTGCRRHQGAFSSPICATRRLASMRRRCRSRLPHRARRASSHRPSPTRATVPWLAYP
jgi:acetyl-CoA C-acetyltransferase